MTLAIATAGVILMGGWISHHVVPEDVPSATLTLSTGPIPKGSWMLVQAFDNPRCDKHPDGTRLAFFGTKRLQGKSDPHDGVDRRVRAGRPIVVSYVFSAGAAGFTSTLRCDNSVSFVPVAGMHYRAHYEMDAEHCAVAVSTVGSDGQQEMLDVEDVDPGCRDGLRG